MLATALAASRSEAFSLLGPYADWMDTTNGFRQPGDIGGPMDISESYRWNVPVVSYAFDQSFLDFFGSDGVAAVEGAIEILNDLPPASAIVLSNYPLSSTRVNERAQLENLLDLKTAALFLLVEHLGLAQPTRSIFVLRRFDPALATNDDEGSWPPGTVPDYILKRNYDPEKLAPTQTVNSAFYWGDYFASGARDVYDPSAYAVYSDQAVVPILVEVFEVPDTAVADYAHFFRELWRFGYFFKGLTRDDVGGVRFLLNSNHVSYETLLPDVHGTGPNSVRYVVGALRPGVEKLTFVRQHYNPAGHPLAIHWRYTDAFITNGAVMHQQVERVITQPDFLFCAGDTGEQNQVTWPWARTGTTNWHNNSVQNGGPAMSGPGVIVPPVKITFQELGLQVFTGDWLSSGGAVTQSSSWGSYDGTTNAPVTYPSQIVRIGSNMTVRLRLYSGLPEPLNYTWHVPVVPSGVAALQVSTDLANWITSLTVTNLGTVVEWQHDGIGYPQLFFRVLPR
jgi:hypothetical protein